MIRYFLFFLLALFACKKETSTQDYRQDMRDFVIGISDYAKAKQPGFLIIPQNGIELITDDGTETGNLNMPYLNAIDGHGQESFYFGYNNDDVATPSQEQEYLQAFLERSEQLGKVILITDYCSTPWKMDSSFLWNENLNFLSFAADDRELSQIPSYPATPHNVNSTDINSFSQAQNFLYLINTAGYNFYTPYIQALANTNFDILILDLFFHDATEIFPSDVANLKNKANGGKRLVIAYMSIGEAEDYRYYWDSSWNSNKPTWLDAENPNWPGNYKVKYWDPNWQSIIYGNDSAYLDRIIDAGFDGVYLDIIDGFEYYE